MGWWDTKVEECLTEIQDVLWKHDDPWHTSERDEALRVVLRKYV